MPGELKLNISQEAAQPQRDDEDDGDDDDHDDHGIGNESVERNATQAG